MGDLLWCLLGLVAFVGGLGGSGSAPERLWMLGGCSGEAFGCPLAILTGVRTQKLWFSLLRLSCFQLFNAKEAFFHVFGGKFGSILITLTGGSRYICELSAGVSIT